MKVFLTNPANMSGDPTALSFHALYRCRSSLYMYKREAFSMARLEQRCTRCYSQEPYPDELATIVDAKWYGDNALEIVSRDQRWVQQIVSRQGSL